MRSFVRLACLSAFYWYLASAQDQKCPPPKGKPGCVCSTDKGTIDLTSIANHKNQPLFEGQTSTDPTYNYFYNPCFSFVAGSSENGPCSYDNVSSCQVSTDGQREFALGSTASETMFATASGDYYLNYDGGTDDRSSKVNLFCNTSVKVPMIIAHGDDEVQLVYEYDLHSECCCPGVCGSAGVAAGIVGIVFMLLFIAGIALYFLVGILVLKFAFHKEGSDVVPNKELWFTFPFLIKDGVLFTFGPCINRIQEKKYTTI